MRAIAAKRLEMTDGIYRKTPGKGNLTSRRELKIGEDSSIVKSILQHKKE